MSVAGVRGGVSAVWVEEGGVVVAGRRRARRVRRGSASSAGVSRIPGVEATIAGRWRMWGQSGVVKGGVWASSERVGWAGPESCSWWWIRVADSSW